MANLTTSTGLTLFIAEKISTFLLSQIYVPGVTPNLTVTPPTGNIIPVVGCILVDVIDNETLYVVTAVDPTTYATTYEPAKMAVSNTDPNDSLVSIISYGNDIFRVYYDTRTSPIQVTPDDRIVVYGLDNASYRIVTNPGAANQAILSQYYDASGTYIGPLVPMGQVQDAQGNAILGQSFCPPCYVNQDLTASQELFIQVFNAQGAQVCQISAFAQPSVIVNELGFTIPTISDISITSTQMRSNNEIYIYEKQDSDALGIQITLTYADGHTRNVPIDNAVCYLYGLEDYVASYPGLQQNILAKYFLSADETATAALQSSGVSFITAEASLVVISNNLSYGVKISTIPRWNNATNNYDLFFYLYNTNRNGVTNVTNLVTINASTPYSGTTYGVVQSLLLELDMSQVDPTTYSVSTIYQQQVLITLQPISQLVRYIIADSNNANYVFGADSTNNRRPQLYFNTSTNQYYIPSLFANQAAFLLSFYTDANAPYDTATETAPPVPTHFQLRDPSSGVAITTAPIPVTSYNTPFNITAVGAQSRYTGPGANVIVEFLYYVNNTTMLTLYGTACDVLAVTPSQSQAS